MEAIPHDPLNATQIGLTAARNGGKSLPDVEPFTLILNDRPDSMPVVPSADRVNGEHRTSTSASDQSKSANHNANAGDNNEPDRVQADDDSVESTAGPQQSVDPPSAEIDDRTDEQPTPPAEDALGAAESAGAAGVTATLKVQPQRKPAVESVESHSPAVKNLGEKRPSAASISGEKSMHHYVDQESDESLSEALANEVSPAPTAKNAKRRTQTSKRQPVAASNESKSKRPSKSARDGASPRSAADDRSTDAAKESLPASTKTATGTESRDRTAVRPSKRSSSNQISSAPTASNPGDPTKSEAVSPALTSESPMRSDRTKPDTSLTPAQPSTPAHASGPQAPRLHDHLIPRSARKAGDTSNLNPADQNRFLQRVARAFDAAKNRDGEIRLRLSPPELGSLRLEVRMQQGGMIARLEAETPAARNLLIDNLPVLRERLAEQGVHIEQFDVDLLDRRDQSNFHDQGQPSDDRPAAPRRESEPARGAKSEPVVHTQPAAINVTANSKRINVII